MCEFTWRQLRTNSNNAPTKAGRATRHMDTVRRSKSLLNLKNNFVYGILEMLGLFVTPNANYPMGSPTICKHIQ